MNLFSEEWKGAKSHKFQHGLHIVQSPCKRHLNLFTLAQESPDNHLANVQSKRHFEQKPSELLDNWKPSIKVIRSPSPQSKNYKLTELPCTTYLKPLRHIEKFKKLFTVSSVKSRSNWTQRYNAQIYQKEVTSVRDLDRWEATISKSKSQNILTDLRARIELYKSTAYNKPYHN